MSLQPRLCWMCNERVADSREHKFKRTYVSRVTAGWLDVRPLFVTESSYKPLQGPKSTLVKFGKVLCKDCNTTKSQPLVLAYERFSDWLFKQETKILNMEIMDFRAIYGKNYRKHVIYLLQYFMKQLGCRIADDALPVPPALRAAFGKLDLTPFAVSFAKDPRWAGIADGERVLHNFSLIGIRVPASGALSDAYMSGFSIGHLAIIYRHDFPNFLPWEGKSICGATRYVRLGRYKYTKPTFQIGKYHYDMPALSEQKRGNYQVDVVRGIM